MSKHTPGPWKISESVTECGIYLGNANIVAANGLIIVNGCSCCVNPEICGETLEEAWANAYLIKAAPNLLEALEWYVKHDETDNMTGHEYYINGLNRAEAAIAKATGRRRMRGGI